MSEEQRKVRLVRLARFVLSRLVSLAAAVQVVSLDVESGRAVVYFRPSEADVVLLTALKTGAS